MSAEIPSDNPVEPIATGGDSGKGENNPPPEMPPASRPPNPVPPSEQDSDSNETRKELREWGKFTVEFLTLIAVIWYACIASHQLTQMKIATQAAKVSATTETAQMVLDARPWINLIPGEGVPDAGSAPTDIPIGVQFTISNPGKTAAVDLKWETFNVLVRPGEYVEPRYVPVDPTWTTKMYPGNSRTSNVTLSGPTIHSAADNKLWQNRKMWEELAIRITYRDNVDATHPVHTTESCIFVIWGNAANPQCPAHNNQN